MSLCNSVLHALREGPLLQLPSNMLFLKLLAAAPSLGFVACYCSFIQQQNFHEKVTYHAAPIFSSLLIPIAFAGVQHEHFGSLHASKLEI